MDADYERQLVVVRHELPQQPEISKVHEDLRKFLGMHDLILLPSPNGAEACYLCAEESVASTVEVHVSWSRMVRGNAGPGTFYIKLSEQRLLSKLKDLLQPLKVINFQRK